MSENKEHISIDFIDIFLIDYQPGKGKIIVSDTSWGYNFSHYWGAMGENTALKEFLQQINSSYFVEKLSPRTNGDFDSKKTFRNFRKYIREEFSSELPWHKHMEFQKDLREEINNFEASCCSENQFVGDWDYFVKYNLNYHLIDNEYDRKEIESLFNNISEPWSFIEYKQPHEHIWLEKLHKKLKKKLKNKKLCGNS